jgi:hypothetical protein|tara:strand:+ start:472 stop:765 length:294 start_codon:yes stop_codon:yes gene_type:complete
MTVSEWDVAEVDLADDITTILAVPALLGGWYVNVVLSNHACPIKDDTTQKLVLPAQLAAGTLVKPPPTRFETKLIVDPDNAATGKIAVFYRDLARND